MEPLSEIKENIRKIASPKGVVSIFTAQVKSVDGETCSIDLDGLVLNDVRLRAVVNNENSKILVTPKVGSNVTVADMNGDKCGMAVIGYSEVDRIEIDCADKIVINGSDNKGLVKIDKLTEKLNAIEQDINMLKGIFSGWVPVTQDGGAALKAAAATWASGQLQMTQISDYEDTKITH